MNVAPDGISTSYRERVINAIAQGNNIGELEKIGRLPFTDTHVLEKPRLQPRSQV